MGSNRKPRKQYKPKIVAKPLGMRDAMMFEMPGYAASLVLGTDSLQEQHIYDLLSAADMTRRIAPNGHPVLEVAQPFVEAVAEVQNRAQRTGKLGVTGDELVTLRNGIGKLMAFLRSCSNAKILKAAQEALTEFDKYGCLRV